MPYKTLSDFNTIYNQTLQKDAIGNTIGNSSLAFLHHWSLYSILAITEQGKTLLLDFATDANTDLHQPKNIFQYISGPVNLILKAWTASFKTSLHTTPNHIKIRSKQIVQYELTYMFTKFLLEQYENQDLTINENTKTLSDTLKFIEETFIPSSRGDDNVLPPHRISLLFILGYASKMTQWIQMFNIHTNYNDDKTPFSDQCNLAKFIEKFDQNKACIHSGRPAIPVTWDINRHFEEIRKGEILWEHTFQFGDQMTKSEDRDKKKQNQISREKKKENKNPKKKEPETRNTQNNRIKEIRFREFI